MHFATVAGLRYANIEYSPDFQTRYFALFCTLSTRRPHSTTVFASEPVAPAVYIHSSDVGQRGVKFFTVGGRAQIWKIRYLPRGRFRFYSASSEDPKVPPGAYSPECITRTARD